MHTLPCQKHTLNCSLPRPPAGARMHPVANMSSFFCEAGSMFSTCDSMEQRAQQRVGDTVSVSSMPGDMRACVHEYHCINLRMLSQRSKRRLLCSQACTLR